MTDRNACPLKSYDYGEPADVLRLEEAGVPEPRAGLIRVRVHACGLVE
jgi:NADPH:quinone reductase-like Zn-dependent oxidoreductase